MVGLAKKNPIPSSQLTSITRLLGLRHVLFCFGHKVGRIFCILEGSVYDDICFTDQVSQWPRASIVFHRHHAYLAFATCSNSDVVTIEHLFTHFGRTASNTSSVLVFEAYDEPAKSPTHPDNAENYYGIFDSNCLLKDLNTRLLPNTSFDPSINLGCQGFNAGSTFSITGTQPGNATNQPSFLVEIQQTNPATSKEVSMDVQTS